MPSTINLQLIGVWFCVGFFTGAGWAIAAWRTLDKGMAVTTFPLDETAMKLLYLALRTAWRPQSADDQPPMDRSYTIKAVNSHDSKMGKFTPPGNLRAGAYQRLKS
jgi:hypothetical protein